jgi:hypothetical protein
MDSDVNRESIVGSSHIDSDESQRSIPELSASIHGPPRLANARGQIVPNPFFWTHLFAIDAGIIYFPRRKLFQKRDPESHLWHELDQASVMDLLRRFLLTLSQKANFNYLEAELSQNRLDSLLKALKTVARSDEPDDSTRLDSVLLDRLERQSGSTVTTQEIYSAYTEALSKTGAAPVPLGIFQRLLPRRLYQLFGVVRRNDVIRDGRSQRGYWHLKLSSDGSDGSDG